MGHELKRHSIELRNEITGQVPVAVSAAAEQLNQVLLNLLVNSVHAIESAMKYQGRRSGHFIRLGVADQGSRWVISVQDSGCGISPKNLRNLFKPFFTTKEIGVGTGLGLATSYRIVESWGGGIEVNSTEGVGTEFRISLPKSKATY
jgi:signal transduction histidine kinase